MSNVRPDPILFGLTVRGEPVELPAPHPGPFDKPSANGGCVKRTVLRPDPRGYEPSVYPKDLVGSNETSDTPLRLKFRAMPFGYCALLHWLPSLAGR